MEITHTLIHIKQIFFFTILSYFISFTIIVSLPSDLSMTIIAFQSLDPSDYMLFLIFWIRCTYPASCKWYSSLIIYVPFSENFSTLKNLLHHVIEVKRTKIKNYLFVDVSINEVYRSNLNQFNHLHQFKQIGRKSRLKNRFSPWSRIIVKNYSVEVSIRLVEHFAEIR